MLQMDKSIDKVINLVWPYTIIKKFANIYYSVLARIWKVYQSNRYWQVKVVLVGENRQIGLLVGGSTFSAFFRYSSVKKGHVPKNRRRQREPWCTELSVYPSIPSNYTPEGAINNAMFEAWLCEHFHFYFQSTTRHTEHTTETRPLPASVHTRWRPVSTGLKRTISLLRAHETM